jgi:hypothetical protein
MVTIRKALPRITPASCLLLDCPPLRFNSGPTKTPTLVPCLSTCSVRLQTQAPQYDCKYIYTTITEVVADSSTNVIFKLRPPGVSLEPNTPLPPWNKHHSSIDYRWSTCMWLTTGMATVNNGVCCADHPWSLPQPDDQQTRKARRVDDQTAAGFCKYHGDESEKCRKRAVSSLSIDSFWPP